MTRPRLLDEVRTGSVDPGTSGVAKHEQIGNAIPPLLAAAILAEVL